MQGDWLSFGDAQFTVGQANGGNTTSGSYPAGSKPYPAVRTNGDTASGQWVQNAVTFTSNEPITIGPEVDLSTIKIRGSKALDDDGWFVVIPASPPSGATHFIKQTVVGGNWGAPAYLTLDGNNGLGFYYGANTIGFAVRNGSFADTTSRGNPTGLFADFEITADCVTPVALQPTTPLICAAGTTASDTVQIGPFTTNARDWQWTQRTVTAGSPEAGAWPLFDDFIWRSYFRPANLATGSETAARWISPGTVAPAGADVPGVPYPVATGQSGFNGTVFTMNQPVVIGNNVDLNTVKLTGRFGFDNNGDSVFVNGVGTTADDLPNGWGGFITHTTLNLAGFVQGSNTLGFGLNGGETRNDCTGGGCAMAAIAEFYVTAQCTGAAPDPIQYITFPQPTTPRQVSDGVFNVSATASSTLPVSYSSLTPGVCTVNATTGEVTPLIAGTCTIAADRAGGDVGNVTFPAAAQVTRSVTLQAAAVQQPQTITFPAQTSPQSVALGGVIPVVPAATASSGLPVTYTSLTPGVCTVNGSSVRVLASGTCTIAADQAGNANWQAAQQATQSIAVAALSSTATPVPTLDAIGLGLLSLLGAGAGGLALRRRRRAG